MQTTTITVMDIKTACVRGTIFRNRNHSDTYVTVSSNESLGKTVTIREYALGTHRLVNAPWDCTLKDAAHTLSVWGWYAAS